MMRLEEAERHLDDAVDGFRELGARWSSRARSRREGSRCASPARPTEPRKDLREAFKLVIELKERSIITTAAALAKALLDRGDILGARRVLAEAAQVTNAGGPLPRSGSTTRASRSCSPRASATRRSRRRWRSSRTSARTGPRRTSRQGLVDLRVFGPDAAGGAGDGRARPRPARTDALEQALREPTLVPSPSPEEPARAET